ncbi:LemA family protein [Reyranella soli]|uniref:LemA family protein n=1 Tax=Reyranella soli TaxID=1230389 RepID=A0A512NS90_9HYPH|nr:LemA family protein [Reyranella soli]GEP61809.1 LemA family protein [Reyranella soli]
MILTLSRPSRTATLLALVFTLMTVASCGYNTIPTLEEAAKARWADVQNNYQRRADLIPNLVATVEGYAKQEKDVLTSVVEARAKATQVRVDASQLTDPEKLRQFQEAQNQLSGALGRLIAISENYPDLKSNQNFLALQSQLEGTENRIAVARRDYIEAVRAYNTEIRTFPSLMWASIRGSKPMAEFSATDDAQRPPQVKFGK